jgi:ketosteroid isomerase-like protein
MKRLLSALAALSLLLAAVAWSGASANGSTGHSFDRFLKRYEAANTAFVNGDPRLWLSMTAEKDPASIFGGFGGLGESGVEEVHQRYELAARAFQPSGADVDFEYLVKDVRGKLAYTVAIERADVLYTGQTELHEQVLRSTMIFRYEKGAWRIVHRHADTMIDLELPS